MKQLSFPFSTSSMFLFLRHILNTKLLFKCHQRLYKEFALYKEIVKLTNKKAVYIGTDNAVPKLCTHHSSVSLDAKKSLTLEENKPLLIFN
jgi:hypothetical protein